MTQPSPCDEGDITCCPICLEAKSHGESNAKACKNGHFLHSECFLGMARYNHQRQLRCPICRGTFQCETCGQTLLYTTACFRCHFRPMPPMDLHATLYAAAARPREEIDDDGLFRWGGVINSRKIENIIWQHSLWIVLSSMLITHFSTLWSMGEGFWKTIDIINCAATVLLGGDRVIVELLRQIEENRRGSEFPWFFLMVLTRFLHNATRFVWAYIGLRIANHHVFG